MAKNYSQIIGTLKEAAIGRCRQRIDATAKTIEGTGKNPPCEKKDTLPPCTGGEEYGVTSIMKRRHGL